MFEPMLSLLSKVAKIQRTSSAATASRLVSEDDSANLKAVIITDEGPTEPEQSYVWNNVLNYVRNGGTAVVACSFPSFVRPNEIATFFQKADLPWSSGDYHRTDLFVNPGAVALTTAGNVPALPESYSQKAVFLSNVAPAHCWYVTDERSITQSAVFPAEAAHKDGQTAVCLAPVGKGRLGYVGDVNAEAQSDWVIKAMCGV